MLLIKNLQARQLSKEPAHTSASPIFHPPEDSHANTGMCESQTHSAHTITDNVVSTVQSSRCSFVNHICLRPPSQQPDCYSFHYFLFIIMKQQLLVFQLKKRCSFLSTSKRPLILALHETGHQLLSQTTKKQTKNKGQSLLIIIQLKIFCSRMSNKLSFDTEF